MIHDQPESCQEKTDDLQDQCRVTITIHIKRPGRAHGSDKEDVEMVHGEDKEEEGKELKAEGIGEKG
jgi:hypothetical protein